MQLFKTLVELQPKDAAAGAGAAGNRNEKIQDFISRVTDEAQLDTNKINIEEVAGKLNDETRGPY